MNFEEMLKQALSETADERVEKMLTVTKKHRFSLSYRLWEYRTLKQLRKNRHDNGWTLTKARHIVTAFFVAAAIVLTLTACAVIGTTMGRFTFDRRQDFSLVFTDKLPSDKARINIEELYGLPEEDGWKITNYYITPVMGTLEYECGDKRVRFSQRVIHEMEAVDTRNADIEVISIYEENDGFAVKFEDGRCELLWTYDGYLFDILGRMDKNEAINTALSTKKIDLFKNS